MLMKINLIFLNESHLADGADNPMNWICCADHGQFRVSYNVKGVDVRHVCGQVIYMSQPWGF
jgi:hypothetical protein